MQPRKRQFFAYGGTQSNRVSDFRDFVCFLFPNAIFFFTFIAYTSSILHSHPRQVANRIDPDQTPSKNKNDKIKFRLKTNIDNRFSYLQ